MSSPTHRRALLLTDVVDSTALVDRLGTVAAAALWAAHDTVARRLLPEFRGREIDKTDGFLLLFEDPADAAAYATAYHAAIGSLDPPLKARAGLHVGDVVLRVTPADEVAHGAKPLEVDGPAKPLAARVMSVARGGQTLATRDAAPTDAKSHGHWRLKGVAEPIELFEVGGEGVPPADGEKAWRVVWRNDVWLPVREIAHALPRERDAFVGRARDLQELAERLSGAALVSVIGTGGTGKTRLVTRYGWTWLGDYPGGVWFCDLADAQDATGVVTAVARTLGVPFSGDMVAVLGRAIAGRGRCLVILDNFEQVARCASETLGPWVDQADKASFVVTTREVLGLPGESTLVLSPLDAADAEALFLARAKQAGAVIRDEERPVVADIVRLLDQLPLAVELAAARARAMTPKMLLERMSQRFRLLASSGGRHSRQATLRATLDWSWDLLSPAEQAGLAQLSVFEGFTLEAAEATLDVGDAWPTDVVQALLDKSLLRRDADGRFGMLVSVMEYASERLGADREAAEIRHGRTYARLGRPEQDFPDSPEAFAEQDLAWGEVGNLKAAFTRALVRGDARMAVDAMNAAWWPLHGTTEVPTRWVDDLLAQRDRLGPEDRVRCTRLCAMISRILGREAAAQALYEEALGGARATGLRRHEANVLHGLSRQELSARRTDEARRLVQRAEEVDREDGYRAGQALAASHLGLIAIAEGRWSDACEQLQRSVEGYRAVGSKHREMENAVNLVQALSFGGRDDEVEPLLQHTLDLTRELGSRRDRLVLTIFAVVRLFGHHHLEEAHQRAVESVKAARELGSPFIVAYATQLQALIEAHLGRHEEAEAHAEEVLAVARASGDRLALGEVLNDVAEVDRRGGRVSRALARADEALACLGDSNAPTSAHVLATKVRAAVDLGRADLARATWDELSALIASLGVEPGSYLAKHVAAAERALRGMGPDQGATG